MIQRRSIWAAWLALCLTLSASPTASAARDPQATEATGPQSPPLAGALNGSMLTQRRRAVAEVVSSRRRSGSVVATEIWRYQDNDAVTIRGVTARVFASLILVDCESRQVSIVGERFYGRDGALLHSRAVNSSTPYFPDSAWEMFQTVCRRREPSRDFESVSEFVRIAESYPD